MRTSRVLALIVLFVIAVGASWWWVHRSTRPVLDTITVYYSKVDGTTLVPWQVSLGPARDPHSVAFYAAVQCVNGPPAGTDAIRFPAGTRVRGVDVDGKTVDVDLSHEINASAEGGFAESAEFRALVWTLTQPSLGFSSVRVRIDGARVATLPGGHLELDEPLSRSSF
ncbi:MAG TPA: GerMN domain-containing protein [Candidatus Limnocylindria bacterium]|jgi:spore germination protein GerM|nr:GerMN domain-containing protein [Candidatus Limnocylindria bacterium]